MFGIGGPELIVIAVLTLILVGPDQLPKVVKTVGTGLRDLRRAANLAQAELRETMDELVREVEADPPPAEGTAAQREARRKAAEAVARATAAAAQQAGRGQEPPPTPIEPSTVGPAEAAAVAAAVPAADIAYDAAVAANAERATRRREIGDLLAEEAARIREQRERAVANDLEQLAALPGAVPRRGAIARAGSPAALLAAGESAAPPAPPASDSAAVVPDAGAADAPSDPATEPT